MRRKRLAFLMAAVMLASVPASTALGSESSIADTRIVYEEDPDMAVTAEDEGGPSEGVGTDEEPGVSNEETMENEEPGVSDGESGENEALSVSDEEAIEDSQEVASDDSEADTAGSDAGEVVSDAVEEADSESVGTEETSGVSDEETGKNEALSESDGETIEDSQKVGADDSEADTAGSDADEGLSDADEKANSESVGTDEEPGVSAIAEEEPEANESVCADADTGSSLTLTYTSELKLEPGQEGKLEVTAVSTLANPVMSYSWYKYDSGCDEYVEIDGANLNTLSVSTAGTYLCIVSDSVQEEYVYISVIINTGLTVSYDEEETEIALTPGSNVIMTVSASDELDEPEITFTWYRYDSEQFAYVQIGDPASGTMSSLGVSEAGEYRCTVTNSYETMSVFYWVYVDSGLSASADAAYILVKTGDTATLSVSAASEYGPLSYSWYTDDAEDESVEANTASSLTVSGLTAGSYYYYCEVSDTYCTNRVIFYIKVADEIGETATSFTEAQSISAGSTQLATIKYGGDMMYFTITPTVSGTYIFYTDVSEDTCGYLYNADYEELVYNDDEGEENTNFKISYDLIAGETYYLGVRYYSEDNVGTFNVYMVSGMSTCSHTATGTWVTTKAATCTTAGTRVQYCKDCGTSVVVKSETIAATGHTWSDWTTASEATVFAAETQTRTCSVCDATETRTVGSKLTPTITVNATSIKLKVKQSTTALTVTGLANGDSIKSWKSSNKKIVTVNSKGKITAKSKTGSATITITLASGKKQKIKVKVQKAAVKTTKVTVESKKLTLKKGKSRKLLPIITPITSIQKITYKSSNKKVATVNAKGKVVAKKKGTATITIKSGSKKVKVKVTVK
ncbi:MAG: Ig-like domain-containing protein [Clostridiales bacterium]|nr:Ig-like domain-containing protein [Clostridiales bacterium]